jgi:hypothetical protein
MTRAAWAPEAEPERMTPARAEACRQVAAAVGCLYLCPHCAAELGPGAVAGFRTNALLSQHLLAVHGETQP